EISGTLQESGEFEVLISATNQYGTDTQTLKLTIDPAPHDVDKNKELLIVDPDVVGHAELVGANKLLHFRTVMTRLANGADVDAFADGWFELWGSTQTIDNGHMAVARTRARDQFKTAWANNQVRLIAIVNRIDLTKFQDNDITRPRLLGEGRLVYEVPGNPFTVILEYGLPRRSGDINADLESWAGDWHQLGKPGLTLDQQIANLSDLLGEITTADNLRQARTNHLFGPWELREFHLDNGARRLVQAPTAQTPDKRFNDQAPFKEFIRDNLATILNGGHEIPPEMLAANVPVDGGWRAGGEDDRARMVVAFNTCDGCHQAPEVPGVPFQHIRGNGAGMPAALSAFLAGPVTLAHPLPGADSNTHDEMAQRVAILERIVNPTRESFQRQSYVPYMIQNRANREH
ncbi:MAG: hypothetical protein AAF438_10305, partial [Pseudomonadota bacterium]